MDSVDHKVMYISKAFESNIGATMHYMALKEIYGEENVYTVDLRLGKPNNSNHYIAYGKYRSVADRVLRYLQGNTMYISNRIITDVCRLIKDNGIRVVFIEDSVFGSMVKRIKTKCLDVRVISFYHDVKGDLYRQWLHDNKKFIDKIDFRIGIRQEKINANFADINLVFNSRDANKFQDLYGKYPEGVIALPAPIPDVYLEDKMQKNENLELLFVGKKYHPNIVGIHWFVENVLPNLPEKIEFKIVGRGLEYLRDELKDKRIKVVGEVDSLTSYYQNADVVIAPLFDGGGMKSKTVEAVSFGKCFIGTDESLFGFWEEMDDTIRGKSVYCCNTPTEWIDCITKLEENRPLRFNRDLFDLFVEKFSYEAARDKLKTILVGNAKE